LSLVALGIAAVRGRRSVLTFHAGIEQIYFPRPKYPLLLPVFWSLFGLPRWVICNSEEVKAKIVEYGVPASKVIPIPAFSIQYLEMGGGPLPPEIETFFNRFPKVIFCYIKMRPLFYPELTVESFGRLAAECPDVGLLLCGIAGNMEPGIWPAVQARLASPALKDRVLVVDDLPHELFLQALNRSSLYLRTHLSDGVCSSVMESLSLGVPVVAIENHTRPPSVITFETRDPSAIAALLAEVLSRRAEIAARLERPQMRDTLSEEAQLLTTV
jgi:glycosyltransferase involved in cell wall biosynthesis